MSLFEELRRRNVFRVGIAYVIGAWLLLQLTDVLSELLKLPDQVGPVVVAAVVIGLPIVLFAAWAFELTPQGIKRESEVLTEASFTRSTGRRLNALILVLMTLAIGYLLWDKFVLRGNGIATERDVAERAIGAEAGEDAGPQPAGTGAQPTKEATIPRQSIAVLPFTNRSPVAEDEFFIDGIHDDLLTNLARVSGLKVISRTSVTRFRDTEVPIPEIARQLGVATIMEGAVQRAGDMVRINVQLIDAQTDEHLWAQIYDRPLTTENLFDIQSEISEAIAAALKTALTPEEERRLAERPTENLEAYSAYLRGMRDFGRREVESMNRALADFRRAVELDADFAEAWAGIAMVATVMPSWGLVTPEEGLAIAEPAAERAMALDPELGEAHLARAMVLEGDAAEEQFKVALRMLPNHAPAYQWYGNHLETDPERIDEALALFRKAAELDPLAPLYGHQIARFLVFLGRYEEADRELAVVNELDPTFYPALEWRGITQAELGRLDEAVRWNRRARAADPASVFAEGNHIATLVDLRDRERLLEARAELERADAPDLVRRFADTAIALVDERFEGALETLQGGDFGPFQEGVEVFRGVLYALLGDWAATRRVHEALNPGFFDLSEQRAAIERAPGDACLVAHALARTGDAELGEALVRETIDYAAGELAARTLHAHDRVRLDECHAVLGNREETLRQLEQRLEHGHFAGWWEIPHLEIYDFLRNEPRFRAVVERFGSEMARQRANLDRMDLAESAGP